MDKRINFLNTLKNQLSDHIISNSKKNYNLPNKNQASIIINSKLGAKMLSENIQSGIVLGEIPLNSSNAYAEFSKDGTLNFHIFPTINEVRESQKENLDGHTEIKEQKHIYAQSRVK